MPLFIENTQISDDVVLATLEVSSLYTNIPLTEGIDVFCCHYEDHYPVSILCQLTQTIYGNLYGSYLKRIQIQRKTLELTSYKHMASLWELGQQLLFLLFSRPRKIKFTVLLTTPTLSTLQSSLLLRCERNVFFFFFWILRFSKDLAFRVKS